MGRHKLRFTDLEVKRSRVRHFLFLFLFTISIALPAVCEEKQEFELKHADSLEAFKEHINVLGNIILNFNNSIIEANKGEIKTNEKGEPQKATFYENAILKLNDRSLKADQITVSITDKTIYASGNTVSKLKDKEGSFITITSDYQELEWSGESAKAKGNLKTVYNDTNVNSDEVLILYKENKPNEAIFYGVNNLANIEQPNNITNAKSITFNLKSKDIHASGEVTTTIWPDDAKQRTEQDPILLETEELYIDNNSGKITAISNIKENKEKVKLTYQETKGESIKALLIKNEESKKPEKIIFLGSATVSQPDKQLTSEEVIFNFQDKKLTNNTITNISPKTVIYKNRDQKSEVKDQN